MSKQLTGAEILLECLLEQGVDTVFGYPGGAVLPIYDALYHYSDRIRHVLTAHEQGASHAADGYARASGKTGVVFATSGPGATNTVTGIANAYMDSVPLVVITGNVATSLLGLDSFQEVDITGITMPITKHNFTVRSTGELADVVRRAFAIAGSGRKGPVLVDIPRDVSVQSAPFCPQELTPAPAPALPPESAMQHALELLASCQKPFIYAGGGVISAGASDELAVFARLLDAPIATSLMGKGCFDSRDPRFMGMLGMHGTKTSSLAVTDCDLFVGIGTRFSDRVALKVSEFAKNAALIHIDIDDAEIGKNVAVASHLRGDAKAVLSALNHTLAQQSHAPWMAQIASWQEQYPLLQTGKSDQITPQYVFEVLNQLTGGDVIVTTEVGQHQMWAAEFFDAHTPRTFITSGGLGAMGFGLGAAIGAQIARPDKRVVNIAGDGSFHMNCNELVTVAKNRLPIVELLFNNNVLGMVRQWQRLFYGKRFCQTTLDRGTDYVMLANAYGIDAVRITARDEVRPALEQALSANKPVLIDCAIDPDFNVLPMVPAGESISHPIMAIEG